MNRKKKGKTVRKNTKGYSTLSILEREVYSKSSDCKPYFTDRSIMEIAVYNPTVQDKKGIWVMIKEKIKRVSQKEN